MTDCTSFPHDLSDINPDDFDKKIQMQAATIANLEEKLRLLDEEKNTLRQQINEKEEKYDEQRNYLISRFVNADFCLAQAESVLPAKRARWNKFPTLHSNKAQSRPDLTDQLTMKYFLEPAANLVYRKLHEATKEAQIRVRQSNDDLLAWKFSPDSPIGKRLMSRMRQLLDANEELGRANQTDHVSSLESEAEIQATCMKEFIKTQEGIEAVLEEAYMDLEGLQSSLLTLHQQINQAEAVVDELQNELEARRPGRAEQLMTELLMKFSEPDSDETGDPNEVQSDPNETGLNQVQDDEFQ